MSGAGAGGLQPGQIFAGYRIDDVAGRGGMGVVYKATELALERTVALKVITPDLARDDEFRRRFIAESKAAAAIEHPHVLPVFSVGERDDVLFIAMRFIEGDDLRVLLRAGGPMPPATAAEIVRQVASALDAAHARGLVHRDIKPANVLLDKSGQAYLTDFGLTKRLHDSTSATRTGEWVGTVGYVAPEQIRGERVDARADVYALGCVLFHTLTGRPPFAADLEATTIWSHLEQPPPSVGDAAPEAFDEVIARAMAKEPADRYPSAGDLGKAAVAAAAGRPIDVDEREVATGAAAHGESSPERTRVMAGGPALRTPWASARPSRRTIAAATAAAVVVIALAVLLIGRGGGSNKPTAHRAGAPHVVATVRVPRPDGLAFARGDLWTTSYRAAQVTRVDSRTNRASAPIRVPAGATAIAAGFKSLWIANQPAATVTRIDLASRKVGAPIPVGPGKPFALAISDGGVWVGNRAGAKGDPATQGIVKIDPRAGTVAKRTPIPLGVQDVGVGFGAVWVSNRRKRTVTRIDLKTGESKLVSLALRPGQLAIGAGYLWVANPADDQVTRIDPKTFQANTIAVGRNPSHIAVGHEGTVWVTNSADSTLTRIDASTGRTLGTPLSLLLNPGDVLVSDDTVWVASVGGNAVQRVER
jgi:streptogramin lyase